MCLCFQVGVQLSDSVLLLGLNRWERQLRVPPRGLGARPLGSGWEDHPLPVFYTLIQGNTKRKWKWTWAVEHNGC